MTYTANTPIVGNGSVSAALCGALAVPVAATLITLYAQAASVVTYIRGAATYAGGMTKRPHKPVEGSSIAVVAVLAKAARGVGSIGGLAASASVVVERPHVGSVMQARVLTMRHDQQVLGPVVVAQVVEMVDILRRKQAATEDLRHDQPVLWNPTAGMCVGMLRCPNPDIAVRTQQTRCARAASVGAVPLRRLTWSDAERLAAGGTGKINGHWSFQSTGATPRAVTAAPGLPHASILPIHTQSEAYE